MQNTSHSHFSRLLTTFLCLTLLFSSFSFIATVGPSDSTPPPPVLIDDVIYVNGEPLRSNYGLVRIGDDFYYVGANGKIVKNSPSTYVIYTHGLHYPNGDIVNPDFFPFDAEGKMVLRQGLIDGIYYVNNFPRAYAFLIEQDGYYYYIRGGGKPACGEYLTLSERELNGLCDPDGNLIKPGRYYFDTQGHMILGGQTGIIDGYYLVDGAPAFNAGLVKLGDDYYYIQPDATPVRSGRKYVYFTNWLKFPDGTSIPQKSYDFDADGRMIIRQGLYGNVYYHNNAIARNYGLIAANGGYYFVGPTGAIIKNKTRSVTKTNGLTFPDGTPIPTGTYTFGADGKMVIRQGLINGVYYVNNHPAAHYGLIAVDGDYYCVGAGGAPVKNTAYNVTNTNGLTYPDGDLIPTGTYRFDATGKMILDNVLIGDIYYQNGAPADNLGLIRLGDDFYYIADGGRTVKNTTRTPDKTNGLTFPNGDPVPNTPFSFDADGRMIVLQGFVGDVYYVNNVATPYDGPIEAPGTFATEGDGFLYNIGILSDIHAGIYQTKLEGILRYYENRGVDFVCNAGDVSQAGFGYAQAGDSYFIAYKTIADKFDFNIYVLAGNHDNYYAPIQQDYEKWVYYTGCELFYTVEKGDDVYIFVSQEEQRSLLSDSALLWLYDTLEANRNKRCFLFFHSMITNDSGNPLGTYTTDLYAWMPPARRTAFLKLLQHYDNVTAFHGHSHFGFETIEQDPSAIYTNKNGFRSVHVPSVTVPGSVGYNEDGSSYRHTTYDFSEAYYVSVFEDHIILDTLHSDHRVERDSYGNVNLSAVNYQVTGQIRVDTDVVEVAPATFYEITGYQPSAFGG